MCGYLLYLHMRVPLVLAVLLAHPIFCFKSQCLDKSKLSPMYSLRPKISDSKMAQLCVKVSTKPSHFLVTYFGTEGVLSYYEFCFAYANHMSRGYWQFCWFTQ